MSESLSDATLLERLVIGHEEAAFAALVRRHGPRVQRICRRILRNEHDVEDVFQATFLVLSRKAAGIPWRDSVSPWLDGVARRLAMHARSGAARQRDRETLVTALVGGRSQDDGRLPERYHPVVEPSAEVERRDVRRVIDDELGRLPEKYRAPVVLCDLEGHTREEAARRLGWPTGSMSRRLDRARSLLRRRLTYRGLALAALGVASMAIAAAIGLGPDRTRAAGTVREAMSPFKPVSEGGQGYGPLLGSAALRDGSAPDFARILPAAREAVAVTRRLEGRDVAPPSALWDQYVDDMKRSAMDVERACRRSDAPALLAAARRLDASCLNCHAVFRQDASPTDRPIDRMPFRSPSEAAERPVSMQRSATIGESSPSIGGPCPPDAISGLGQAVRSLAVAAPSGSHQGASNEWMVAAVRVGGAPSTGHRRRWVDDTHPT
jgi:RNA polymerase sigma factor (sigma-70 family)